MASNHHVRSNKQSKATTNLSLRSKLAPVKRSAGANHRAATAFNGDDEDSVRVRVAVRLRPKNAEDLASGVDFDDCVELQPEMKRLKLKRNNWSSESFKFDEVFTEGASQKRVYEVVAKPVVDSVLNGYNGTVMAYGQTGTGKTYTVGQLGTDDPSKRGIMVRAVEDIIAATSSASDTVSVSYLQLYLESIQDLLAPEKNNIPIVEDPKTGEVSFPGAALVKVQGLDHFLQLLEIGEANRHAANTKLNTNSSRSHAILMVHIQRSAKVEAEKEISCLENDKEIDSAFVNGVPMVLKSKLLIVDLAGSERIDKSGSEGLMLEEAKSINLSLTSLGKCINALAENSPHIPTRDSKLTRLLRDSFGGSAKTSLIITIGPSARHHSETASTIMFGQRAMKVVNTVKLKEEFDYKSLCRNLEYKVDHLTAEIERQQKLRDDDKEQMEKKLKECKKSLDDEKKSFAAMSESLEKENFRLESDIKIMLDELNLEKDQNDLMCDEVARLEMILERSKHHQLENSTYQKVLADTTQMYENKIMELIKQLEDEHSHYESAQEELAEAKKLLIDHERLLQRQKEMDELGQKLHEMYQLHEEAVNELQSLKVENKELLSGKAILREELQTVRKKLLEEEKERKHIADELVKMQKFVSENYIDLEAKKQYMKENIGPTTSGLGNLMSLLGLQKILFLLKSEDLDIQIHAVKVVANLATEDMNQEKIVEEGGLDALLMLLGSSQNMTIHRIASGAIANLAMNEINQALIMSKGGARLLANIASKTDDPQTLRMVAGAIANLCGNERLHVMLNEDGGTKALLGMVKSGHSDVIAQIARGMANFAKCESRGINQGHRKGRSHLIKDGALPWLIANSATSLASTRRHVELALCHLAQNEDNAQDFISSGAMKELIRISHESNKEDIRNLARKTLNTSPTFIAEMQNIYQN